MENLWKIDIVDRVILKILDRWICLKKLSYFKVQIIFNREHSLVGSVVVLHARIKKNVRKSLKNVYVRKISQIEQKMEQREQKNVIKSKLRQS